MRKAFLVLLFACICGVSFAASKVGMFGAPNSSGVGPMEVDSDRVITIATDAGLIYAYERATTSDTLTATESGKVISVDCTSSCEFDLPAAETGMKFTFVSETNEAFYIDPNGTDLIRYAVATSNAPLSAGDRLLNSGITADSVTLFSTQDNYWTVLEKNGTWADGN